jgi:hypothetical protein
MVEGTVRTRLQLSVGAIIVGALLGACNGSDSSGADSAGTVNGVGRTPDTSAITGSTVGLRPWGPVSPPGTVTISWEPPTENTNGTALTDLAGFNIHYGTQSQNYTSTIQVANPGITRYVVENLPAGTYYFAVSGYTATGEDSTYSPQVTATVD